MRIDTKIDNLKIVANARAQILERADQAVVNKGAEHRTAIITEDKNGRAFSKIVAQAKRLIRFVSKDKIARNLPPRVLFECYAAEITGRQRIEWPNERP